MLLTYSFISDVNSNTYTQNVKGANWLAPNLYALTYIHVSAY